MRAPKPLRDRWHRDGLTSEASISGVLAHALQREPWAHAVVDGGVRLTARELDDAVAALAASLVAAGVRPGSAVLCQAPNWWETVVVTLATWRVGAACAPMSMRHDQAELRQALDELEPEVVVAPERHGGVACAERLDALLELTGHRAVRRIVLRGRRPGWDALEELLGVERLDSPVEIDAGAPCAIAYTAGTTDRPRGVVMSSRALVAEARQMTSVWGLSWDDAVLVPIPLTHVTGMTAGLVAPLLAGATVVLQDAWDPERALELALAEQTSFSTMTPAMLEALCDVVERRGRADLPLRQLSVGGASVAADLIDRSEALGMQAFRGYGLTEHCSVTICNRRHPLEVRRSTDGPPAPGTELLCIRSDGRPAARGEIGLLHVRGPERMLGYVQPSDNLRAFDGEGGWLDTGDLAWIDDRDCLHFVGRRGDVVLRRGTPLAVRPAELALVGHPAVSQAALVPRIDPRVGESAVAFVALHEGAPAPDDETFAGVLDAAGIPAALQPSAWSVVPCLPSGVHGRVRKSGLLQATLS